MRTLLPIATFITLIYAIAAHRCTESIAFMTQSTNTDNTMPVIARNNVSPSSSVLEYRATQTFAILPSTIPSYTPQRTKVRRTKVVKKANTAEHTSLYMIVPIHH